MEADVVAASIRNAITQGCERVYLVDNDSPDATIEVARREGAILARTFRSDYNDEALRLHHMNEVVREVSESDGASHIWWLFLDADEFSHGPTGMTLREYLSTLDVRFRVVGTRYFNHYPDRPPHYVPGRHPLDFQPLCEEITLPMCPGDHRKHPLLRFDAAGPPIVCGPGFHSARSSRRLYEPSGPAFLHHFPFREEALTRLRLRLLCGPEGDAAPRALESRGDTHMPARFRSLDAVYAGDWSRVENFVSIDPIRDALDAVPPRFGVHLKPWSEAVQVEHQQVMRWYPMTGAWNYNRIRRIRKRRYGDDVTYRKGIAFLDGYGTIEDWGCGLGYARRYVKHSAYVGIDGSSTLADKNVDLERYLSDTDCIFMRHVLEHNLEWRRILGNAIASFRKRMALVVFTPFAATTRQIGTSMMGTAIPVPDISFRKEDLVSFFERLTWAEESVRTKTQYGVEHLFYLEK
jgi:hypothetical protein